MYRPSFQFKVIKLISVAFVGIAAIAIPSSAQAQISGWVCNPAGNSSAEQPTASACGYSNRVTGDDSVAFGDLNRVQSNGSAAFGRNNILTTNSGGATVLGQDNKVYNIATVVGKDNLVQSNGTVIMGYSNIVGDSAFEQRSSRSVVIGYTNRLASEHPEGEGSSVLIGDNSDVYGTESIAIGREITIGSTDNRGLYTQSMALGNTNTVWGNRSVAFGSNISIGSSQANGASDSIAIGSSAYVTGNNSTALGSNTRATGINSTAIGTGAVASRDNQMSLGTATSTYTTPGITSAASRAAQSGATQFVTTDVNGNLANSAYGPQDIAGLNQNVNNLQSQVNVLGAGLIGVQNQIYGVRGRAYEGTAAAFAAVPGYLPENRKAGISAHYGNYLGRSAVGGSAMIRANQNVVIDFGLGVGLNQGSVGGRAGATFVW